MIWPANLKKSFKIFKNASPCPKSQKKYGESLATEAIKILY